MTKRILFYLLYLIVLVILLYLSFLLYFFDLAKATEFFVGRIPNVVLIVVVTLFLSNLMDLITFRRETKKRGGIWNEIFLVAGKTIVVILIASFVEFFLLYRTKLGRIIYVNYSVLLSFFLIGEHLIVNYLVSRRKISVLWLSEIPAAQVERDYMTLGDRHEIVESVDPSRGTADFDLIVYDYPPRDHGRVSDVLTRIISSKNPVDLISFLESSMEKIPLKYVDELWLLKNLRTYESVYERIRRIINFFSSVVLLSVLFVPSFLLALWNRIQSPGPIFYIQSRTGFRGRHFNLIKFRTMVVDAEESGPRFSSTEDPRVTKTGRLMRSFRLDEVPQLINVLRGEMNLIGPRPERGEFIEHLEREIPFYKLRLEVRPGLTGWAQVNHPYAGSDTADHIRKLEYDLYYIKNRNIALDFVILLKTIKTILTRRGT
jgi:lipopolysaccharide/colanic/teichoic acid biosynthesis glycosyltransferase